jgi:hypothetical protein
MKFLQTLWRDYDEFKFFLSAGFGRSDGQCLLNILFAVGGLFSANFLILFPNTL